MLQAVQVEFIRTYDHDDRHRRATEAERLRLAQATRCTTNGCHPVYERISNLVLSLAVRFHRWATLATRWSASTLTSEC